MCLFNLFSKEEDTKHDLPPSRPAHLGRRTPEATSRLHGSKFASDSSRRSSSDKDNGGYGHGYSSGNGSLSVGGPHGGGLYGGVNGGVYSGVSGGANGGVNGGVYGGVSGTSHGGGLAPAGGYGSSPGGGSRCASHNRTCRYPARSNRGRKHGSINKPDTVNKLLARIEESGRRKEVVAALMDSNPPSPNVTASSTRSPWPQSQAANLPFDHSRSTNCGSSGMPTQTNSPTQDGNQEAESLVSPLHIVTAAIAANTEPRCEKLGSQASLHAGRIAAMAPIKERLSKYFASHRAQKKDWEILAAQSVNSSFKLERGTCDPISSRLIDNNDASLYFQLFFQLRNPVIGLMDSTLHTPEYVYSTSFTLFSVICALGCAVSVRPRDRVIYPVLISLADGNLRWSIAAAVKSLATIQAIINMQYWAPICPRQADDPYWLFVSHAVQLAREIGINRPEIISEYVNVESQNASSEFKDRCLRNYERTWFYTFIADKGFGIVTGRSQGVGWREMPRYASEWWKRSMTEPTDRMISGMVEIRGLLIQAMEKRRRIQSTPKSILEWQKEAYDTLTRIRNDRCEPDDLPSARCLPILAFYMDHSLLVLNAQALKDMTAADDSVVSTAVLTVVRTTTQVASRVLDLLLADRTMTELLLGFQNNQYIMICHAITEILRAIKRGGLTSEETSPAVEKVLAIPQFLDRVVQLLPSSSAGHLYLDLARFFACQVEALITASDVQTVRETIDSGMFSDDWFKTVDSGLPDAATFLDMGYLGLEQPTTSFTDFQDNNSFNYSM